MANDVNIAAPDDAVGRAQRYDAVGLPLEVLAAIGTGWTFGLMLLICADVIGRSFLNAPITGVAEIAAHSVVGIVFLQIGATIYQGRMTRADFLMDRLRRRFPRAGVMLEALFLLIGALVMAFVAQAALPGVSDAIARREFFGVHGLFTVPTWPFRALIVLGGAAGAFAYATLLLRTARRLLIPDRR